MKKICVFFFLLLFSVNLFAEDDEKLKLAVMEFEDKSGKLSAETLSNATEYIRGAFVASNKFIVIAKERQEKAMITKMKEESYKDCNDKNCQIPLGQALSADTILRTTVTFFAKKYTITSELIDLEKEASTKGAKATFDGSEESLNEALDDIVSQIIGRRNKKSEFLQGRFGGKSDDWEIGGGEETIVKFESEPAGAVVIADGKIICQSTPCSKLLAQGNHEIEMQRENYVPKVKKGKITEGKTIKYKLEPDFAWLTITGNYAVSLKLDGANIGEIPIKDKVISTGNHRIEHTDKCFYDSGETFTVKRGEKKNIKFDLEHRESAIKVYAQDEKGNDIDADVFVDNKKVGHAPGTFKVPLCSKKLLIKNGDIEYSEELSLKEKQLYNLRAKLKFKGLQWSNKAQNSMTWKEAVKYCNNLKEGDYTDWRLPSINELRTLIRRCPNTETGGRCGVTNKCLSLKCKDFCSCDTDETGKYNKLGDGARVCLWSSSISDYQNMPWDIYFFDGGVGWTIGWEKNHKFLQGKEDTYQNSVRCVRGHDPSAKKEIVIKSSELAKQTQPIKIGNMQWSNPSSKEMSWYEAVKYCKNLNEEEHSDWRLPNINELRTLIINHPGTETNGSCNISDRKHSEEDLTEDCDGLDYGNYSKLGDKGYFWSSSEKFHGIMSYTSWFVNFNNGSVYYDKAYIGYNVRCVRNAD